MAKSDAKVNFDLSQLNLDELIKVYENINNFLKFLEDKKIVIKKAEDKNE